MFLSFQLLGIISVSLKMFGSCSLLFAQNGKCYKNKNVISTPTTATTDLLNKMSTSFRLCKQIKCMEYRSTQLNWLVSIVSFMVFKLIALPSAFRSDFTEITVIFWICWTNTYVLYEETLNQFSGIVIIISNSK